MGSFTVTNAAVVLPDQVLEWATVRVEHGLIAEIEDGPMTSATEQATVVDAAGAYLMPGVVDLHNDNLEFEINPRPRANLPLPFALSTMERRLAAAGVTTEFHAISFMEKPAAQRTVAGAQEKAAYIAGLSEAPSRAVRHQILHRLDVRTPDALDSALESLRQVAVRYVSLNDHTPGQGQYRDINRLISMMNDIDITRNGKTRDPQEFYDRIARAESNRDAVPAFYRRVYAESQVRPMVISTHDDDTIDKVDAQLAIGATISEFPVTVETAQYARDNGMTIVVGAPNIVRGGSQSGNLAATDLVALGLADAICADYHAPCLIPAAFALVRDGLRDLPAAIRMITLTPARAVGLTNLGAIVPGHVADLALVRLDDEGHPHVEATYTGGRQGFSFARHLLESILSRHPSAERTLG